MPRKVFTAGEAVEDTDLDTYLMRQKVMVFTAGTAAASAAIGTALAEGMVIYGGTAGSSASGLYFYDGSTWKAV